MKFRIPLCQALSSRSADIQKRLKDIPEPKARDVQKAVLAGRPPKNEAISQERLFVVWQNVAKAHGFDTERFLRESRDRSLMAEQIRSQTNASFSSGVEAEPKSHRQPEHKGTQEQTTHRAIAQQKHPSRLTITPLTLSPRSLLAPESQERGLRTLIRTIRDGLSPEWLRSTEAFDKELKRARELSAQRREAFLGKITLLYAIGKVSRSTYLRHKEGRGLPRTKLGIELRYWSGQGSLAERIYLRIKGGHGMPEFGVPKSRFGINLAAATGQISRMQQLLLLKQNGHIKKHQHSHRY